MTTITQFNIFCTVGLKIKSTFINSTFSLPPSFEIPKLGCASLDYNLSLELGCIS
jgi:hypothetical protein